MGAAFAVMLVATSVVALAQFRPGRIDHHNAQILCAVAGLLFLVRSLDDKRAGWIAGCLLGLGLAVGYEAIALVVPALGLAALVAVWQSRHGSSRAAATASRALRQARRRRCSRPWSRPFRRRAGSTCTAMRCRSISCCSPFAAPAGLWAAMAVRSRLSIRVAPAGRRRWPPAPASTRAWSRPAWRGRSGRSSPALKSLWLDHVMETKSMLWLGASHPAPALAAVGFVLAGVVAQIALWRRQPNARTGLAAAFVVLAALLGCWQIKLMPYASWLAARAAGRVGGRARAGRPRCRPAWCASRRSCC